MPVDVAVQYALQDDALPRPEELVHWVEAALQGRREDAEVTVRVVGAAEAARLNQDYRRRPGATNVLSFAAELPRGVPLPLLGDIVICAPLVAREAREQGKQAAQHWAHLVVHGTLHLLGFDHQQRAAAETMEAEERRILARLGFPDPGGGERRE